MEHLQLPRAKQEEAVPGHSGRKDLCRGGSLRGPVLLRGRAVSGKTCSGCCSTNVVWWIYGWQVTYHSPLSVSMETIVQTAMDRGYTVQGEMFSGNALAICAAYTEQQQRCTVLVRLVCVLYPGLQHPGFPPCLHSTLPTWSPAADWAFWDLKHRFTTAPILVHPDLSRQFMVETDASGVGAVLSQDFALDPKLHPCGFSHCLNARRGTTMWGIVSFSQ
ncbi:uncharacterized protein LOC118944109 isoform X1 [Oncorhynchus mykiss]|uniref:uncharacterized protein LOC118944109 isoform X1 n=1 Tax=Oncorhynchus mykiss TaxID=8022 RepID=UPI0018789DF2|nr:uncharacterized protein LOC118944109 isoform X1 [Oncorhynchus mykiss]